MAAGSKTQSPSARIAALFSRFSNWLWGEVPEEVKGVENYLRVCCRVFFIAGREFWQDRIPLRASALTFTVILSLVPLLVLGTSVLKGLDAGAQMRQVVHGLISQMEATAKVVSNRPVGAVPAGPELDPAVPMSGQVASDSLSGHLHWLADTIFDSVDRTSFATMGVIGVLVLLFTVYSLLGSIEKTFNAIWQTGGNRTFGRKLVDYLALLVLLPLSVNFGVAAMAALKSPRLLAQIQQWLPWLGARALNLLPVVAMVATFSLLYGFLPNTRVARRAALTGGLLGGLAWFLLQGVYFKLQILVVRYNAIYGSIAALPLFMLWIYLSWVVFLLGAEISFGTQFWRRYQWQRLSLSPIGRLALVFEILRAAAEDYRRKRLTTRDNLVLTLKQPDLEITELLTLLCGAGLMRYVDEGVGGYLPSAPLAELSAAEIGQLLLGEVPEGISVDNPARRALAAMRATLAETSL